jgi:hypothetical protein
MRSGNIRAVARSVIVACLVLVAITDHSVGDSDCSAVATVRGFGETGGGKGEVQFDVSVDNCPSAQSGGDIEFRYLEVDEMNNSHSYTQNATWRENSNSFRLVEEVNLPEDWKLDGVDVVRTSRCACISK